MSYTIQPGFGFDEYLAVFRFDSDELRGIAAALGSTDAGAQEMLRAADRLDEMKAEESA